MELHLPYVLQIQLIPDIKGAMNIRLLMTHSMELLYPIRWCQWIGVLALADQSKHSIALPAWRLVDVVHSVYWNLAIKPYIYHNANELSLNTLFKLFYSISRVLVEHLTWVPAFTIYVQMHTFTTVIRHIHFLK